MTEKRRQPRYEALPVLSHVLVEHEGLRTALLGDNRQQALDVLRPHIRSLSPSEQQKYSIFIIKGIAGTDTTSQRWEPELQVASAIVFHEINFFRNDK